MIMYAWWGLRIPDTCYFQRLPVWESRVQEHTSSSIMERRFQELYCKFITCNLRSEDCRRQSANNRSSELENFIVFIELSTTGDLYFVPAALCEYKLEVIFYSHLHLCVSVIVRGRPIQALRFLQFIRRSRLTIENWLLMYVISDVQLWTSAIRLIQRLEVICILSSFIESRSFTALSSPGRSQKDVHKPFILMTLNLEDFLNTSWAIFFCEL